MRGEGRRGEESVFYVKFDISAINHCWTATGLQARPGEEQEERRLRTEK